MKKILACLSLALVAACLPAAAGSLDSAAPDDLGFSPQRLQRLSAALEHYVDSGQIAGSVTIVARHGKVAYLKAFGDRDRASHSPMQTDTIFRIASQTKAIVTTAAMILQEQGKLLIQDPVSKYIPEFAHTTVAVPKDGGGYDVVPAERPITIRDLMTHTSGYDYGDGVAADHWKAAGIEGYYLSNRDETIGELAAKMASLPASGLSKCSVWHHLAVLHMRLFENTDFGPIHGLVQGIAANETARRSALTLAAIFLASVVVGAVTVRVKEIRVPAAVA